MRRIFSLLLLFMLVFMSPQRVYSQPCDSIVPSIIVDLSPDPDSVWIDGPIARNGYCCASVYPEWCNEFVITISPAAIGVVVEIVDYIPGGGGAMWTNLDCAGPTGLSDTTFFPSTGPYSLTFCKPGTWAFTFSIRSIPGPTAISDEHEQEENILLYPNPASDHLTIESAAAGIKTYQLKDISGRIILNGTLSTSRQIDLSGLSPGIYFMECFSECLFSRHKILKR